MKRSAMAMLLAMAVGCSGDRLAPGMEAVIVSPAIPAVGIEHDSPVLGWAPDGSHDVIPMGARVRVAEEEKGGKREQLMVLVLEGEQSGRNFRVYRAQLRRP